MNIAKRGFRGIPSRPAKLCKVVRKGNKAYRTVINQRLYNEFRRLICTTVLFKRIDYILGKFLIIQYKNSQIFFVFQNSRYIRVFSANGD